MAITAPGICPLSMSAFSAAPMRASRCDDMPTLSGVAFGRSSARRLTADTPSTATQIATVKRMTAPSTGQAIEHGRYAADVVERCDGLNAGPVAVAVIFAGQDAHEAYTRGGRGATVHGVIADIERLTAPDAEAGERPLQPFR